MKSTTIKDQLYLTPSWEDMGKLCFKLSQNILDKNYKFDRLVALVKGGLTWSRTLLDYLNIKNLSAFQVEFYNDITKTNSRPIIIQSLPAVIEGETILLFDDVVDSGETLRVAKEYLYMCGAKKVYSSSLYFKTWAKIKPDFYSASTSAWIIFPHEIRETITLLKNKWKLEKVSLDTMKKRFLQLGISKQEINFFIK